MINYTVGFYWVKVQSNSRSIGDHWEPAYYNGEEISGWGLCGEDFNNDAEDFMDIAPMQIIPDNGKTTTNN